MIVKYCLYWGGFCYVIVNWCCITNTDRHTTQNKNSSIHIVGYFCGGYFWVEPPAQAGSSDLSLSSQHKLCIKESTIISDSTTEQETSIFSLHCGTHTLCQFTVHNIKTEGEGEDNKVWLFGLRNLKMKKNTFTTNLKL